MIQVSHLTKYYGDFLAVNDLSFEIQDGHVYGFLGPNGAGKSTTMNIMTGCLSPTDGTVKIGGFDSYEIIETHPGRFFENMLASHPFLPKTSRLVLADYVTMDSGTGCVHTAPGFGAGSRPPSYR